MKRMDKWTIFALFLIFIGNVGGILIVVFQSINSSKDKDQIIRVTNENNTSLKEELTDIKKERSELKKDIEARDADNKEKSNEIVKLNKELLQQSNTLNKFLGSSDAFLILDIISGATDRGVSGFNFSLKNDFEYPLYDIELDVLDYQNILDKSQKKGKELVITRSDFNKSTLLQKYHSNLFAKSSLVFPEFFNLPNGLLYIKLKSRNNIVFEKMAFLEKDLNPKESVVNYGFMIYDKDGKHLKTLFSPGASKDDIRKLEQSLNSISLKNTISLIN